MATVPGDDSPEETAAGDTDIEIVAAPSALLLTSNTYASPDGNDGNAEFDVSGMDMDPALAMEIATAPAVASDMDSAPAAASDTAPLSASADINRGNARVPTTDRINRDPQTTGFAAADSKAVLDTAAEPGAADTEPAEIAASRPASEPAAHATADQDMEATAAASDETGTEDTAIPAGADMPGAISEASPETGNTVIATAEPEPVSTVPSPAAAAADRCLWLRRRARDL